MKKKGIHFIIPATIYPVDILVSIAEDDKKLKSVLNKMGLNTDIPSMETCNGYYLSMGCYTVLRLKRFPDSPDAKGTLAHEVYHAVQYICDYTGIKESYSGSEPGAYLTTYITNQIYSKV